MSQDPPSEADAAPRDDVPPPGKPTLKQRLAAHVNEFGTIAIVTYITLSILTIIGFSIAIGVGASPSSASGVIGVIFAGWVAGKATLPIRILLTLALTPLVAVVVAWLRRRRLAAPDAAHTGAAGTPGASAATAGAPESDVEVR